MIPRRGRVGAMAVVALLLAALPALAQIPPSALPGREREQFQEPTRPRARPGGPNITLPSTVAPPGAERIMLVLVDVQILGSTIYRADELRLLYEDLVGRTVSLAAVYEIAQRITAKYGRDGYVLSRAIIPPQELTPGGATMRIQVIEGYIDRVEWPTSLSRYVDFFSYYTAKIVADRPANVRTLERYLLLAGDLPGLKFKNSLKPSADKPGAATLVIEVAEKPIDALARVDNRGTRPRGPYEYFGSAFVNNALRMHESFGLNYAASMQSRELQYVAGNWRQVLTPEGLYAFVNGSYAWGKPGLPVDPVLEYKTKSAFVEGGLTYPVIRQRERNFFASLYGFVTDDQSDALGAPLIRDRLRGVRAKIETDAADWWNGINQLILIFSHGFEGMGSSRNGSDLLSRQNGRVDFSKLEVTFSHLQPLPGNFSALGVVYGQTGFTPLLSSELCGYGGRLFGRAYEPSALLGDSCIELLGELRYDLPPVLQTVTTQLYGYADAGWLHNIALVGGTPLNVDGASVGGGVRLGWQTEPTAPPAIHADLQIAKAVSGPIDAWRFFFILTGRY